MNQKALHTLEYDKIIRLLIDKATSDPGRKMCENLQPGNSISQIDLRQEQTAAALDRLFKKGSISFGNNHDFSYACKHLAIGGSLSCTELLQIAGQLENVTRIKSYGRMEKEYTDCLSAFFDELEPLTNIQTEIRRCIIAEDEYADDASSTLRQIRRQLASTGEKIHSQLLSMVNGSYRTYLQDAVITMRNNRYCLPVKAECKGQVPGMVHERSQTGSTLFIEPAAVVDLNNKIKELEQQEAEEIEVILAMLSASLAEHADTILRNGELMTILDFVFAKAELAMDMNATRPVLNEKGILRLRKARHPLLKKDSVVPIDIHLGDSFKQLIITGPNTGGKTVSLKTAGLLCLMAQAGLHIPALDRSEICVFREIFADIGDEQSIEQSLSTFSSHMTNIVHIMKEADNHSLCLFDELCAGTDPTEGAALAIAILSSLNDQGIRCMATTHYSELKLFAMSTPGVQNASCEFDVATLMPTYRLIIGIPGKSNAFAISKKLGLSDDIIERAKTNIDSNKVDFETLLSDLENSRKEIERDRAEIARFKEEARQLQERAKAKDDELSAKKAQILADAREEAADILEEAKEMADSAIKKYNKWTTNPHKADASTMENERKKLRTKMDDYRKMTPEKRKSMTSHHTAKDFKAGDTVHVISMDTTGTVTAPADSKGNIKVQMGILSSLLPASDLVIIETPKQNNAQVSINNKRGMGKALNIQPEINVLGMTVAEATSLVDRYLDDAMMAHLHKVRIIHGKGTGALRKGIHDYLRKQSYVKSFRLGEYGEGEAGVTIVEL